MSISQQGPEKLCVKVNSAAENTLTLKCLKKYVHRLDKKSKN